MCDRCASEPPGRLSVTFAPDTADLAGRKDTAEIETEDVDSSGAVVADRPSPRTLAVCCRVCIRVIASVDGHLMCLYAVRVYIPYRMGLYRLGLYSFMSDCGPYCTTLALIHYVVDIKLLSAFFRLLLGGDSVKIVKREHPSLNHKTRTPAVHSHPILQKHPRVRVGMLPTVCMCHKQMTMNMSMRMVLLRRMPM